VDVKTRGMLSNSIADTQLGERVLAGRRTSWDNQPRGSQQVDKGARVDGGVVVG
jgi:hypothetical protein